MKRLLLLLAMIAATVFLAWHSIAFGPYLLVVLALFTLLWLWSLRLKDSSIVDSWWGAGFALIALTSLWLEPNPAMFRDYLVAGLVTIWALRLGLHIHLRNHGHGEDPRYAKWRAEAGARWWWQSWLQVFLLQAVLLWIIAAPLVASRAGEPQPGLAWLDWVGVGLWCIGFYFETVGDWQLKQFKADRANQGKVMDRGLWSLTRHPNYFGDAVMWWGYFCFAATVGAWEFVFAPLLMTVLLMKVSGVALLEEGLSKSKPGYADYIAATPAFFPRLWPRRFSQQAS